MNHNFFFHSEGDSSASVPQVLAMSDIMAGTTLEDLEYSDDGDDLESDEDDIDQVCKLDWLPAIVL